VQQRGGSQNISERCEFYDQNPPAKRGIVSAFVTLAAKTARFMSQEISAVPTNHHVSFEMLSARRNAAGAKSIVTTKT
jgi:hypothetical protein